MLTSIYTADVKLNKNDKDYKRSIIIMNPEQGVLIIQNTLFVMSFENFEQFTTNVDYNDIRLIEEVNI